VEADQVVPLLVEYAAAVPAALLTATQFPAPFVAKDDQF